MSCLESNQVLVPTLLVVAVNETCDIGSHYCTEAYVVHYYHFPMNPTTVAQVAVMKNVSHMNETRTESLTNCNYNYTGT